MSETITEAMSATEAADAAAPEAVDAPELGDGGKKALQAEREARKQAEQQAKSLQAQIDSLNAEKMSDLEKAQAAAKVAADEAAAAKVEALRYRLAAKHGISDEDATLFLTASDEAAMQAQAERLAARTATQDSTPRPRPDLTQGGQGKPVKGTTGDQFAAFIESKL